jgi:outer membrane biosynthesis protein TonB
MSSNSGKGINGILPQNLFQNVTNFFTNFKPFDFLMHRGKNDIPYGFMSIATIAAGSFTYVTYKDYSNEISSGISDTLDSIQSSEIFIPSVDTDTDTDNENNMFDTNSTEEPIINQELDINIEKPTPSAPEEEEPKPTAPEEEEPKPTAPEESKKNENEPGEKYKMGGRSKKHRKRKNKTKKTNKKMKG